MRAWVVSEISRVWLPASEPSVSDPCGAVRALVSRRLVAPGSCGKDQCRVESLRRLDSKPAWPGGVVGGGVHGHAELAEERVYRAPDPEYPFRQHSI